MCSTALLLLTTFVLGAASGSRRSTCSSPPRVQVSPIGGLLFLDDVSTASWVLTPVLLALGAVVHARALFAGEGPFRT